MLWPSSRRQMIFGVGKPSARHVMLMLWFSRTATDDGVLSMSMIFGGTLVWLCEDCASGVRFFGVNKQMLDNKLDFRCHREKGKCFHVCAESHVWLLLTLAYRWARQLCTHFIIIRSKHWRFSLRVDTHSTGTEHILSGDDWLLFFTSNI